MTGSFDEQHGGGRQRNSTQSPSDYPGDEQGSELTAEFTVLRQVFVGLTSASAWAAKRQLTVRTRARFVFTESLPSVPADAPLPAP